jgi:hypothetical protein
LFLYKSLWYEFLLSGFARASLILSFWLVAGGWCWFVLREEYCWLVAGGWFVLREKYCWLVADKPSEQTGRCYKPTGSFLIDDFSFSVVHWGEALNGPM